MKKLITLLLLFGSLVSVAQPGGYVEGTFVNWVRNSRDHGFFQAQGFSAAPQANRRVWVALEGDGQTNSSGMHAWRPGKYLEDAGANKDGKYVVAPGDTIYFMIVTIFNTSGNFTSDYKADIESIFSNTTALPDSSVHANWGISGWSGGVGRMWGTLLESGFVWSRVFGSTLSISTTFLGTDVTVISSGRWNSVWRNGDDANGGTPVGASDALYDDLSGFKRKYYPASTGLGHSPDSAYSLLGTDTALNWWKHLALYSRSSIPNTPPTANAGADQTLTLPTNSTTLSGSASTDPDGTIVSYAWTKISGGAVTITSPSSVSTTITGMVQGVYNFRLAVTDDSSAVVYDTVVVNVGTAESTTRFYPTIAFSKNGRKTFDPARLIDRDTLTKLSNTDTDEPYSLPGVYFIIFDNKYNGFNMDSWQMGGDGTWEVTLLTDDNDNHFQEADGSLDVGDSLTTFTIRVNTNYMNYKHYNLTSVNNVRGLRIIARTSFDKQAQNYEFRFFGDSVAPAPTVYRTETIVPIADPGPKGRGIGGLDNVNKTFLYGFGESWRTGFLGAIFNREVTSRVTSYTDPSYEFFIGRNGTNAFNTTYFDYVRSLGVESRIYFAGGDTKNLTAPEAATYDYSVWSKGNGYKYIEPGADSSLKVTWAGEARRQKMFATLFGSNTSASLSGFNVTGGNTTPGQGGLKKQEPGNEYSRNFNSGGVPVNFGHYPPPVLYSLMDTVYPAIKSVDPNILVYLPALTYLDTVYIKSMWGEHWLRYGTSKAVPWDGWGFNIYFNDFYDEQGGDTGNVAMVPGRWNVIKRFSALNAMLDKLTPNHARYDITEFSGGSSNEITTSSFNVGYVAGKTDQQLQCDNTFRDLKHMQIGGKGHMGTAYYYQYGHDGSYQFDFMALVDWGGSSDTLRTIGKVWTQINTIERPYSGWADTLRYGDSTGTTVAVQNAMSGTNKLYSFWRETTAVTTENISINLGPNVLTATLINYDYNSTTPIETPLTITSNTVNVTAQTKGAYIRAVYSSGPPAIRFRKFRRIR